MEPRAVEVYDEAAVLARVGGDRELLCELLAEFTQAYGACADEVRRLASAGASAEAARLMHAVKGAAANLGADEIRAACHTLERQLQERGGAGAAELEALAAAWQRWQAHYAAGTGNAETNPAP